MTVLRNEIIDWEPAILTVVARQGTTVAASEVLEFLKRWLSHREKLKVCSCFDKYLSVRQLTRCSVRVACEWLCNRCIDILAEDMKNAIPCVGVIKLGIEGAEERLGQKFIQIPEKTVQFEDQTTIKVASFVITQEPVSCSEFEKFVFATNYLTTAERKGESENFRDHFGLSGFSGNERARLPANFLSYEDARAYCTWAGLRMPSEPEVISAALIDTRVYQDISDHLRKKWKRSINAGTAIPHGMKLTGTTTPEGVITRKGPFPFLVTGWERKRDKNRRVVSPEFYDATLEFHVCM